MRLMQQTTDGSGGYTLPSDIPTDFSVPSVSGDPGFAGGSMSATPMTTAATDPSTFFSSGAPGTTAAAVNANPQTPQAPDQSSTDPTWLTTMNKFLTSPVGQIAGAAIPAVYGLSTAAGAQRNINALTNSITATARPGQQVSDATYRQMTGGAPVGGPMGQYISGTTGAANQLAQTAGQYASGNLTPAQQMQVRQNLASQNAQFSTQLGAPGGMGLDSSAAAMMRQQNENNAALLTQQLELNNINLANAALKGATDTYTSLLTSALNQAKLGTQATSDAVQQQIAANQQLQKQIQGLLQDISKGLVTASQQKQPSSPGTGGGAVAQQGGSPGQIIGQNLGGAIKQVQGWFGGGTPQTPIAPDTPTWIPQNQAAYNTPDMATAGLQNVQLTDIPQDFTATPAATDTGATSYAAPDSTGP